MLRCIELVHLRASGVTLNPYLQNGDPVDQKIENGPCCGEFQCERLCPWLLAVRVLADHTQVLDTTSLFPDKDGCLVPKVKMAKAWMDHLCEEMTGHSARRSGAMWYARRGLPIHAIGALGRWKSSAVFRYIEEALQDIPLNEGAVGTERSDPMPVVEIKVRKSQVKTERAQPAMPEQPWAASTGRNGRVSHRVRKASWSLSLSSWDTWCGWHFAEKNVKVMLTPHLIKGTHKCKRCEAAHPSRDAVKGGLSLANW